MWLRETAIAWMDGTPSDDRERFRSLANVVFSCFDSCLEDLQTDYVGKIVTELWSHPRQPDATVSPDRNDKDLTVASVSRACDAAELMAQSDDEVLAELLRLHLESLLHLAELRGWDKAPFLRAAECVRLSGFVAEASLPNKKSRFRRDLTARAWGVINAVDRRVYLAVHDQSGHELRRVEAPLRGDWHTLRAGLHKIVCLDGHSVELQPRQRAGIDLGPRLRIQVLDDVDRSSDRPSS